MKEMKEKEVREVLKRARELIAPEGAWIQWEHAEMRGGAAINPESPAACRWCLTGAISRAAVAHVGEWSDESLALSEQVAAAMCSAAMYRVQEVSAMDFLEEWNDEMGREQGDVLALIDLAIAAPDASTISGVAIGTESPTC